MWPFFDFQYDFRCFRSITDPLIVLSDRIARTFIRTEATQAVALDIPKAFERVRNVGSLRKLNCYGISGQIYGLISSFRRNRWLQVVLDGKSVV